MDLCALFGAAFTSIVSTNYFILIAGLVLGLSVCVVSILILSIGAGVTLFIIHR